MSASPALPAADRLVQIVFDLRAAFGARAEGAGALGAVLALVARWLDRLYLRLVRLAAHARAGALRPPLPRERTASASPARRPPPPRTERLPQKLCWLAALIGLGAAASAEDLRAVLADPETAALLARAPQLARLLRALCRALGVAFPKGAPPAATPAPAAHVAARIDAGAGRSPTRRTSRPGRRSLSHRAAPTGRTALAVGDVEPRSHRSRSLDAGTRSGLSPPPRGPHPVGAVSAAATHPIRSTYATSSR